MKKKKILTKKNNRSIVYKELLKSYIELEIKLKLMAENFKTKDSEIN